MSLLAFQDIVLNVRRAAYLKWRRSVTTLTVPFVRGSCGPNTGAISYVDSTRIRSSNLSENDHDADSNLDDSNLDEYQVLIVGMAIGASCTVAAQVANGTSQTTL